MNRLQHASSPYLRQHAENPVDWFEWGDEPFALARERDVPIFLSVGYASCHWCHVMAHESFENADVASQLNDGYVSIKVDREERPDIDAVYMSAVQLATGRGGWPMSVFTTPDGEPFFAGTYWPREDRGGMPGFPRVLHAVTTAWRDSREDVLQSSRALTERLQRLQHVAGGSGPVEPRLVATAAAGLVAAWDRRLGGFGQAPKFPQAMAIDFLLAHAQRTGDGQALKAAVHSLDAMCRGGIYDHVGGGFARYATDERWLVPHFEKMLYDNALLLRALVHASVVLEPGGAAAPGAAAAALESDRRGQLAARFRRVARETADYLLSDMSHPEGGLYSSTDADSEGEEGRFFVWSAPEFREVVATAGENPDTFAAFYGVTEEGNWEGTNILHEPDGRDELDAGFDGRLQRVRLALHERREQRVHPGLDDKVLTSWNALAIGALAEAGALLGESRYLDAARRCALFVRTHLWHDGRLQHSWREGHGASVNGLLEDVAALAPALLVLYEVDPDPEWVRWARQLVSDAEDRFADPDESGTYFATAHDAEPLITRPKDLWDNAQPAGPSGLADAHLRLAALTGDADHRDRGAAILAAFSARVAQAPTGYGELLRAAERHLGEGYEVAVVGPDPGRRELTAVYHETWRPASVLAQSADADGEVPLLADRPSVQGRAAAYVCRDFVCERPVTAADELRALLSTG